MCLVGRETLVNYDDDVCMCSCMMNLGQHHPSLVVAMSPDLLSLHPYFESVEPDIDDPACILAHNSNSSN